MIDHIRPQYTDRADCCLNIISFDYHFTNWKSIQPKLGINDSTSSVDWNRRNVLFVKLYLIYGKTMIFWCCFIILLMISNAKIVLNILSEALFKHKSQVHEDKNAPKNRVVEILGNFWLALVSTSRHWFFYYYFICWWVLNALRKKYYYQILVSLVKLKRKGSFWKVFRIK